MAFTPSSPGSVYPALLCLLLTLGLGQLIHAQGSRAGGELDPSAVYLQAYLLMQEAEKLETNRNKTASAIKYNDARELFDSVARSFPQWKTNMVNYRRRKIREKLVELGRNPGNSLIPGGARIRPPLPPDTVARPPATGGGADTPAVGGSASAEIRSRFAQYEAQIKRLNADRQELYTKLEAKESDVRNARIDLRKSQKMQEDLRKALLETEQRLGNAKEDQSGTIKKLEAEVAGLKSQLDMAIQTISEANTRTANLLEELEGAHATIKELREIKKMLTSERDQLAQLVRTGSGNSGKDAATLTLENQRLRRELDKAQKSLASLGEEKASDREEIEKLRGQITSVSLQLEEIQVENADYKEKIANLTNKLTNTRQRLVETPELTDSEALEENRTLKGIVLRQLKAQWRREQAKQLVLTELTRLQTDSRDLLKHLDEVAGPPIVLDDKESSLFKDPQFEGFLSQSTVHASLVVPRGKTNALLFPNGVTVVQPDKPISNESLEGLKPAVREHAKKAKTSFERGDFKTASNQYQRVIEEAPQSIFALEELSVVKMKLDQFKEAEKLLKKALAYNDNANSHFLLGVTYFRQGKNDLATKALEHGLLITPENARARHYLGVIAVSDGRQQRAELEFKEAITIDPAFADAHFNLAVIYATADEPSIKLARKHYEEAVHFGAEPDAAMELLLGS